MDLSNFQPILNLLGQNMDQRQTKIQNFGNSKQEQKANALISSYYPSSNIDGSKIGENSQNFNKNNQPSTGQGFQNQESFPQMNMESLMGLLSSLAPNLQGSGANPLLSIMQNFLKPNGDKQKNTSTNILSNFLKNNKTNNGNYEEKSSIEDFKNVNDIEIDEE